MWLPRNTGKIRLISGQVNLLATKLSLNREQPNLVIFTPEDALDPVVDVSLIGDELQANVKGLKH